MLLGLKTGFSKAVRTPQQSVSDEIAESTDIGHLSVHGKFGNFDEDEIRLATHLHDALLHGKLDESHCRGILTVYYTCNKLDDWLVVGQVQLELARDFNWIAVNEGLRLTLIGRRTCRNDLPSAQEVRPGTLKLTTRPFRRQSFVSIEQRHPLKCLRLRNFMVTGVFEGFVDMA